MRNDQGEPAPMPPLSEEDRETLTAYLDGELDEVAEQALEARLGQDAGLRDELDAMKQTWGMLDFLPKAAPTNDFTNRTIDRLTMEGKSTQSAALRRGWPLRRVLAWAGCVLVTLGLGYASSFVYRHYFEKPIDPDEPIVRHMRLLERLASYGTIEDLEFLKALDDPDLFGDDGT